MNFSTPTTEQNCPREEISLYLDGELAPTEEILLEKHLAECEICSAELNLQKQMLSALDFAFDKRREIELPKDFTKVVVTKAESEVSGLRCKKERFQALFLCSALFLPLLVGFGAESEKIFSTFNSFGNQVFALADFLVHFIYDISLGLAVILRSLSQQIVFSTEFVVLLIGTVSLVFLISLPRFVNKLSRFKTS
jgi:predicted anti-sigma-YlaC factor YlaD